MKEFVLTGSSPRDLKIDYDAELNDQQLQVVKEADGASLVLAGAGSGKTRTITYRVAWLMEHGVSPENILLVTFTNKASREMIERVEGLLGSYPKGLWAGTFHSIANRLLRKYAHTIGYQSNFSILSEEDARDLISLCVKDLKIDTKKRRFPSNKVLLGYISYSRNRQDDFEWFIEHNHPKMLPIIGDMKAVANKYAEVKKLQNAMDFDDLLINLLELLQNPEIISRLSNQFQYVLVDEFQDTNIVQAKIIKLISSTHKNVLVVGDDAQSIYSFRAAEIRNILDFPNSYEQAKTFRLTKNYRSTPQILSIANAVIQHNEEQFDKELSATRGGGSLPELIPARSTSQEAQYIAEKILDLHAKGTALSEIAVLFRAAFHSQALEFELMKRDIPYDYRGGMKFFERSHVKDIVSHLRLLNNLKDGMAWVRALRIHPGIGLVTAGKISAKAGAFDSLRDAVDALGPGGKRAQAGFEGFRRIIRKMLSVPDMPSELIRALASSDDYKAYIENEFPNYQDRLDDLEQFAVFAEQFNDLGEFLDAVSLTDEYGVNTKQNQPIDSDRIILSTIHQAKGLEWDAVFIMNLADGKFPNKRAMEEADGVEEERRLFYVATTRARSALFMTYPITAGYEHVELQQPSMFIDEIPKEMYETVKLRHERPRYNHSRRSDDFDTIVLDELGEQIKKPMPSSFLKDIT